jgi:hypothetical protein
MATGTGLEYVFGVPDLTDEGKVQSEYAALVAKEGSEAKFFTAGPFKSGKFSVIDGKRTFLYLRCLQMCLNSFPSSQLDGIT